MSKIILKIINRNQVIHELKSKITKKLKNHERKKFKHLCINPMYFFNSAQ